MSLGLERTGLVEEGQRRLKVYGRFVGRPAPPVDEAVAAELKAIVETAVAAQVARIRPVADSRQLARVIDEAIETAVKTRLDVIISARIEQAIARLDGSRTADLPSLDEILAVVAGVTGFAGGDILGPRRARSLAAARQFAIWLVTVKRPDLSLPQIGRLMRRDRTTLTFGVRKVDRHRHDDPFRAWLAAPPIAALLGEQRP